MSQVSRIALVFVFVFVNLFGLLITLNKCLKGHKSLGLLLGGVLKMSLSLSLSLSLSIFFGHVMSSHHSEQMSQRSQVSRMGLRRGSQNFFVFVIVFVFVNFFGHVMSSHHSEQISQRSQVSRVTL